MKWSIPKWRNDFNNTTTYETWYDLFDDWDLIESSFTQQYGIRLRKNINDMKWGEFVSLLEGLSGETVLGNVVRIRSENDPEQIKHFNKDELKIRSEWRRKSATQISEEDYNTAMENIKNMFINMAKKGR